MISGNGKNDGSMAMIFRICFILIASIMLLGCPYSYECPNSVVFSARHIPPVFDSIRVEVYNLQDSLIFFQTDTIDYSGDYYLGCYIYGYNVNFITNLKISIHCANGWQSFQPIEAGTTTKTSSRGILFSYDGTDKLYGSKRIPAEPIGNICEIPDSAVFIIDVEACTT